MADDLDDLEAKARAARETPYSAAVQAIYRTAANPAKVLDLITRLRAEQERADRMRPWVEKAHCGCARAYCPALAVVGEHDADRGNRG